MQVGVSTATFFGKEVTEDTLGLIKGMGVDVCEVFLTTFSEYTPQFSHLLKSRLDGLSVHSIHTLTNQFEPQLTNRVKRTRDDALDIFRQVLASASNLGAKYYTFHGGAILKVSQKNINFSYLGAQMNELCNIAGEYGVELCQENVHWAVYQKPGFMSNILRYAPNLKSCLDIKQAMQSGYDYRDYLAEMSTTLKTVHICDYDSDGLKPIGEGSFDFRELVSRLRDVGYDGPMIVELYSGDYKDYEQVKRSVEYINNIIKN